MTGESSPTARESSRPAVEILLEQVPGLDLADEPASSRRKSTVVIPADAPQLVTPAAPRRGAGGPAAPTAVERLLQQVPGLEL
jgi:hypothetical protein